MSTKKILLLIILVLTIGIFIFENFQTQKLEENFLVEENGTINVYFCQKDNCEAQLAKVLNESKEIECAFYDLSLENVRTVLSEKNADVLIDEDNFEGFGQNISSKGLMHNKFCILDDKIITTGSMNPTYGDNFRNDNNFLIIESNYLAENYRTQFNDIKTKTTTKTPLPNIIFNGYALENYFCPEDKCQKEILSELKDANSSIYFLTFTFTDKDIAAELIEKHNSGLKVMGIIENTQNHEHWNYPLLSEAKIPILIDINKNFQHNKVFIIDEKVVITGSMNPTKAANTVNDENILIIRQPDVVAEYVDYFNELYNYTKNFNESN